MLIAASFGAGLTLFVAKIVSLLKARWALCKVSDPESCDKRDVESPQKSSTLSPLPGISVCLGLPVAGGGTTETGKETEEGKGKMGSPVAVAVLVVEPGQGAVGADASLGNGSRLEVLSPSETQA
jgi:hypothetical protein